MIDMKLTRILAATAFATFVILLAPASANAAPCTTAKQWAETPNACAIRENSKPDTSPSRTVQSEPGLLDVIGPREWLAIAGAVGSAWFWWSWWEKQKSAREETAVLRRRVEQLEDEDYDEDEDDETDAGVNYMPPPSYRPAPQPQKFAGEPHMSNPANAADDDPFGL